MKRPSKLHFLCWVKAIAALIAGVRHWRLYAFAFGCLVLLIALTANAEVQPEATSAPDSGAQQEQAPSTQPPEIDQPTEDPLPEVLSPPADALAPALPSPTPTPAAPVPPAQPTPGPSPASQQPTPTPLPTDATIPPSPPQPTPPNGPLVVLGGPPQVPRSNYGPEGNRKAAQLRSQQARPITFSRSALRDVLIALASEAGIPFVGPPERSMRAQRLISIRMTASPFSALETVARQNDIRLTYDEGVWYMGAVDKNDERIRAAETDNELVGRVYVLKHEHSDLVRADPAREGMQSATPEQQSAGAISLPLQTSQLVFRKGPPQIINDIRVILGLPPLRIDEATGQFSEPETGGGTVAVVPRTQLPGADGEKYERGFSISDGEVSKEDPGERKADAAAGALAPVYVPPVRPQVIFNSDTNVLWVVATRKQHEWVATYLQQVDRKQDLIAIEVKFFETKKNPQTDLGINWANTFGTGLTVGGQASIGSEDSLGSINFDRGSQSGRDRGNASLQVQDGNPVFTSRTNSAGALVVDNNYNVSSISGNIPYSAVLNLQQFSFTIQAFMSDRDSSLVQYPRVLTMNNREVAITSAENQPVNAGVSTVQSGGTSSQPVGELEYIPIGTRINILPKVVGEEKLSMTVAITISSVIGEVPLNLGTGINLYPVTSSRVYNASLQVDSGYTLAVGGLEKVNDRSNVGGIPLLKDIPGLGYLFKNKQLNRDKVNLIIFITPFIIKDATQTGGISEIPESVIPIRPGSPPPAPAFSLSGELAGGDGSVDSAIRWLEFKLKYHRQLIAEGRTTADSVQELHHVIAVARQLADYLENKLAASGAYPLASLISQDETAQALLIDLNKTLATAQEDVM